MATPETKQYFDLTPEEAEPYMPVFGELYWWDAPVLEAAPARVQTSVVDAGMFGKSLLNDFEVHNNGVQSLQDATASYERATLSAGDMEQGQVVQTIYEALKRDRSYDRRQTPGLFSARETESGFEIVNQRGTGFADYEHRTRWFVVAQAGRRKQGFFELDVDHHDRRSFSSLVENGVRPVLKIRSSNQYGSSHLIGGETIPSRRDNHELYERIRKMRVFSLIQVGRRGTYIDTDLSNSRPV